MVIRTRKYMMNKDRIYRYICDFVIDKGYPPTVREIGQDMGMRSTSTVHGYLRSLEDEGLIRRESSKNRAIDVIKDLFPVEDRQLSTLTVYEPDGSKASSLTEILGEGDYPVPQQYLRDEKSFLMRVHGDAMINAGICNGDFVVAKPQETAENRQIIVVMLDGVMQIRRFYREGKRFRLEAENDSIKPIRLKEIQIMGVVTGLFRKF